jgi:hypothetical protein
MDGNLFKFSEPTAYGVFARFVGGAAAITKTHGKGVAIAYIGTGIVELTFEIGLGEFCGLLGAPSFQATTAANVKGCTCVPGAYNTVTRKLRLNMTSAAEALRDLAVLEWLSLTCVFKAEKI